MSMRRAHNFHLSLRPDFIVFEVGRVDIWIPVMQTVHWSCMQNLTSRVVGRVECPSPAVIKLILEHHWVCFDTCLISNLKVLILIVVIVFCCCWFVKLHLHFICAACFLFFRSSSYTKRDTAFVILYFRRHTSRTRDWGVNARRLYVPVNKEQINPSCINPLMSCTCN